MRLWKILLIAVIVASGFATGYVFRSRQTPPAATQSGSDPNLVLPPPPTTEGESFRPPLDMIAGQFNEKASLPEKKPSDSLAIKKSPSIEPLILPPEIQVPSDKPDSTFAEPNRLPPPVIRLPAPPDEPLIEPAHNPTPLYSLTLPHSSSPPRLPGAPFWVFSSKRDIQINFDVTKRGASGIKAVELWGRRNSANDYEYVDRMEGDKPPFATRLWSEGLYEFRAVFVGGTGVKSAIPTNADTPELCVCLDMTPPVVEMLPVQADPDRPGAIRLRWKAEDAHLDKTPIRLEYSIDGKEWLPIGDDTAWIPNTGLWSWVVPNGLPTSLHLRVLARDKAGNVGYSRTPSAVPVDLTVPEGRISGFVERLPKPREKADEKIGKRVVFDYVGPDGSHIHWDGGPTYYLDGFGEWQRIPGFNEGFHSLDLDPPRDISWCEWLRKTASVPKAPKPKAFDPGAFVRLEVNREAILSYISSRWNVIPGYRALRQFNDDPPPPIAPYLLPFSDHVQANSFLSDRHVSYLEQLALNLAISAPRQDAPPSSVMKLTLPNEVYIPTGERELLPMPKPLPQAANDRDARELLPMPTAIADLPSVPNVCRWNSLPTSTEWIGLTISSWIDEVDEIKDAPNRIVPPEFHDPYPRVDVPWERLDISWCEWVRRKAALHNVPAKRLKLPVPIDGPPRRVRTLRWTDPSNRLGVPSKSVGDKWTPEQLEFDRTFARLPLSIETYLEFLGGQLSTLDAVCFRAPLGSLDVIDGELWEISDCVRPPLPFPLPLSDRRMSKSFLSERHESYLKNFPVAIEQDCAIRLARAYASDNDFHRATIICEPYLAKYRPDDRRAPAGLGALLLDLERAAEALPYLWAKRRILEKTPKDPLLLEVLSDLVRAYARLGERGLAMEVLDDMKAKFPENTGVRLVLGNLLITIDEFELAGQVFNQVLQIDKTNGAALIGLARVHLEMFNPINARRILDSFIPAAMNQRAYLLTYAAYHEQIGEYIEAEQIYKDMLRRDPFDHEVRYALGAFLEHIKEWERANDEFAKIPPTGALGKRARLHFAQTLASQREFLEAADVAKVLIVEDPDDANAIAAATRYLAKAGKYSAAFELARGYLVTNPKREQHALAVRSALARALLDSSYFVDSLKEYEIALAKPSGRVVAAFYGLARVWEKLGEPKRATQLLGCAAFLPGGDVRNRILLADEFHADFEDRSVIDLCLGVLHGDPENLAVLIRLVDAQERESRFSGNPADTFKTCLKILKLSPTNVRGHLAMLRSFAVMLRKLLPMPKPQPQGVERELLPMPTPLIDFNWESMLDDSFQLAPSNDLPRPESPWESKKLSFTDWLRNNGKMEAVIPIVKFDRATLKRLSSTDKDAEVKKLPEFLGTEWMSRGTFDFDWFDDFLKSQLAKEFPRLYSDKRPTDSLLPNQYQFFFELLSPTASIKSMYAFQEPHISHSFYCDEFSFFEQRHVIPVLPPNDPWETVLIIVRTKPTGSFMANGGVRGTRRDPDFDDTFIRQSESVEILLRYICGPKMRSPYSKFSREPEHFIHDLPITPFPLPFSEKRKGDSLLSERHEAIFGFERDYNFEPF